MVLTVHYGNFTLRTITSLKVKVRFGKQHPYLISHTVASMLKMEVAACLFWEMQFIHSSCLFKLGLLRSNDNSIVQNYPLWFKKMHLPVWKSGDGRFKKSSAAQCYPVKNSRAQAPVTTLTTATCICNFKFLLSLDKLMFLSLNVNFYIVSTGNVGCITTTLGSTLLIAAELIQVLLSFSWRKTKFHYCLCFCRAVYLLDDLELYKSLPYWISLYFIKALYLL